jgi:Major Facilitator Superfamily.
MKIILLLGLVSLFADITYESARSISGPFLASLGAGAFLISFVGGLGEFIGYGLRIFAGYISDKLKNYWCLTILGYFVGLFSPPLLAFSPNWQFATTLILAERFGKAIRSPARDTILSLASKKLGYGKGFAIHEALDQIGSVAGPFFISFILANFGYKPSFLILFIPAILSFLLLISAERIYKKIYKDENLKEEKEANHISKIKKSKEWKKIPVILFFIFSAMTIFLLSTFSSYLII